MKIAIDISQYSGEVTAQEFLQARAEGCSRVIVALNNLPLAQRQIDNALQAGLEVQAYIYYYFGQDVIARTKACLPYLQGRNVNQVWIDCEDEKHTLAGKYLAGRIRVVRDYLRESGYTPGIYTARWWWQKYMGSINEFSDLPLWDATWDKDSDIDLVSYGGWSTPAMSQHTNDTTFAGIWCDINSYEGVEETPTNQSVDKLGIYGKLDVITDAVQEIRDILGRMK